jgi:hypothetical protein
MKLETKTKITILRVVKSAWSQQKGPNGCRCERRSGSRLEYWVREVMYVWVFVRVSEPWHESVWGFGIVLDIVRAHSRVLLARG